MKKNKHSYPLISICITCYNAIDTISRCVDSALGQKYQNIEIIIVDDFSSDGCQKYLIDKYSQNPLIKVILKNKNGGPASSRNTSVNNAKGEYVVFFDDDDFSFPNRLEVQLKTIKYYEKVLNNSLICCYASGIRYYSKNYKINLDAIGSKLNPPTGEDMVDYILFNKIKKKFFYGSGVPTYGLMVKKKFINLLKGFDENLRRLEDADFAIRFALNNGYFVGTKDRLLIQYSTNSKDKTPLINYESELKIVEKYKNYLIEKKMYEYAKLSREIRFNYFKRNWLIFFKLSFSSLIKFPKKTIKRLINNGFSRLIRDIKI